MDILEKTVSFVIPCYRSEHTLESVVAEIHGTMEKLGYGYEIILVNDCSPDATWEVIRRLCRKDGHIRGINFARNFGQHAALMAGLRQSVGEYVVCLDDDGQTPADEPCSIRRYRHRLSDRPPFQSRPSHSCGSPGHCPQTPSETVCEVPFHQRRNGSSGEPP